MAFSIMALGPFQFRALNGLSFQSRRKTQKTDWAKIPVAGGFDVTQWLGGTGRSETISGVLFGEFGGQSSLEGMKLIAAAGSTPLPFVDLSAGLANVFGLWVIEEISEGHTVFDTDGTCIRNAYEIKLHEYAGGKLDGGGSLRGGGLLSYVDLLNA